MSVDAPKVAAPAAGPNAGFRLMTAVAVAAVIAVNLGILGYAVYRAAPAAPREVPVAMTMMMPAGNTPAVSAVGGDSPTGVVAPLPIRPSVVPVANTAMLPSRDAVLGVYAQHCAACHGPQGRGDGLAAPHLMPRPRNFVDSPLRFVQEGATVAEREAAARRAIMDGVARSAMVGFRRVLTEAEIAGLANYVVSLNADPAPPDPEPLDAGTQPPTTPGLLARGANLFESLGCVGCHGTAGRGDGPNIDTLVDSLGFPIGAADFTTGVFKSGPSPEDLVRTVLRGIPGTPMIGYESAVAVENPDGSRNLTDAWALVAHVQSFSGGTSATRSAAEPSGTRVVPHTAADAAMLLDPTHREWLGVAPTRISLWPVWEKSGKPGQLAVRAARNKERLSLCLEWTDPTWDAGRDHAIFPDAVAVMLAMTDEAPAIPMGVPRADEPDQPAVNIWHWQAHRLTPPSDPPTTQDADAGERRLPSFITASDSNNPLSESLLADRPALESNARGFGSLTLQDAVHQDLTSSAFRIGDVWRVVIVRELSTGQDADVDFALRDSIPVAFAVWDGSRGDRGGTKLVSSWHHLILPAMESVSTSMQTAMNADGQPVSGDLPGATQ